jgi:hypothetical protein
MVATSQPFTDCIKKDNIHEGYEGLEGQSPVMGSVVRAGLTARAYADCAGDVANKNQGFITALAACFIAIFMVALTQIARQQIKIADSIVTGERPWLFIAVNPFIYGANPACGVAHLVVKFPNHGRTPAIIETVKHLITFGPKPETTLVEEQIPSIIGPGEDTGELRLIIPETVPLVDNAIADGTFKPNPLNRNELFVGLMVQYLDVSGIHHMTHVCWQFSKELGRWVKYDGDRYNYFT